MNNQNQLKDCLICGREIFRGKDPNRQKRYPNSVTCSKLCSNKYSRVFRYVKERIARNKGDVENEDEEQKNTKQNAN